MRPVRGSHTHTIAQRSATKRTQTTNRHVARHSCFVRSLFYLDGRRIPLSVAHRHSQARPLSSSACPYGRRYSAGHRIGPDLTLAGTQGMRTGGSIGLYDFAYALGATVIRTAISRTVIDCNRDPSGASLYPGKPPLNCADDRLSMGSSSIEPVFAPDAAEIACDAARSSSRNTRRLRGRSAGCAPTCHIVCTTAIRSASSVPRLFEGVLPNFNIVRTMVRRVRQP